MPVEIKSRLEDAETQLTAAIEILNNHQDTGRLLDVLVNRAGVRGMLGKFDEALEDCSRVLSENLEDKVACRNQGIVLLHLGRPSESIAAFEKLKDTEEWADIALMVASNYYDIDEPEKSVQTIEPLWEPGKQDHHELLIAHLLIKACHKLNHRESIARIVDIIRQTWPNDPEALMVLGQNEFQDGKFDEAFALMREGLRYAEGNQRDRISLRLAASFYSQKRFAEAAETYESIVDTNTNDVTFREYLTSLFNAGNYIKALKLAKPLEGTEPPSGISISAEYLQMSCGSSPAPQRALTSSSLRDRL